MIQRFMPLFRHLFPRRRLLVLPRRLVRPLLRAARRTDVLGAHGVVVDRRAGDDRRRKVVVVADAGAGALGRLEHLTFATLNRPARPADERSPAT